MNFLRSAESSEGFLRYRLITSQSSFSLLATRPALASRKRLCVGQLPIFFSDRENFFDLFHPPGTSITAATIGVSWTAVSTTIVEYTVTNTFECAIIDDFSSMSSPL